MGIYDRDYYRGDQVPPLFSEGPAERPPLSVSTWIVLINVAVFVFTFFGIAMVRSEPLARFVHYQLKTWPDSVFPGFRLWQLLTGSFLHADILHILFNMWFLYMFGKSLERIIGRRQFLAFYLTAAVVAGLCFVTWAKIGGSNIPAVGASGAVMGTVVLYAFHRPREQVFIWGIIPLQVRWLAILFVGGDILLLLSRANTNVAHCAHIGGAAFGVAYWYLAPRLAGMLSGPSRQPPSAEWTSFPDAGFGPDAPHQDMDAVDRRVDQLLNKISRGGLNSLTDEERRFLEDASKRYR